jgi:flagellar biosynthesis/type III secretory pathway protein FliH
LPGVVIPEIDDLREVKAMLAERWEQWTREWEQRGLQQGLQQGLQEGREEGQRQERLRIARSLLDVIADDRLLAERIGLSAAEVRRLREGNGSG